MDNTGKIIEEQKNLKDHSIYVMVSLTGTIPSKMIRRRMDGEYAHVSISLDRQLHHMYSFGRLYKYFIQPGGLVHELPDRNVYTRFPHTKCRIYEVKVTEEQYKEAVRMLQKFWSVRKKLVYNNVGLLAANFNRHPDFPNAYYCSQFVGRVLQHIGVDFTDKNYRETDVLDFVDAQGFEVIYEGELRDYWNRYCVTEGYSRY